MCELLNTAELKCWGDNQEYALGMGIAKNESDGDEPFEMGDDLISIQMPTGKKMVNLWVSAHVRRSFR